MISDYALSKFNNSLVQLALDRPKSLSVIDQSVIMGTQVEIYLLAFPFKSANKDHKVFEFLPGKAKELAHERLNTMCIRIRNLYRPGAKLTIISDGLVYNYSSKTNRAISLNLSRLLM